MVRMARLLSARTRSWTGPVASTNTSCGDVTRPRTRISGHGSPAAGHNSSGIVQRKGPMMRVSRGAIFVSMMRPRNTNDSGHCGSASAVAQKSASTQVRVVAGWRRCWRGRAFTSTAWLREPAWPINRRDPARGQASSRIAARPDSGTWAPHLRRKTHLPARGRPATLTKEAAQLP